MVDWAFYVKFSLLQTDFESIIGCLREYFYLLIVESVYIRVTSGDVRILLSYFYSPGGHKSRRSFVLCQRF